MAFVDLKKMFDRGLGRSSGRRWENLVWRNGIVWLVLGMYANAQSHVCVGVGYSEEFKVKVGIRGTAVTSRISAPTEKAEVIQILDYGVNRSLVTITGNGCSLKQILSSIKIMIYWFVYIEINILFSLNYHCQYHWLYIFDTLPIFLAPDEAFAGESSVI